MLTRKLGTLEANITADTKQLTKDLKDGEKKLKGFGKDAPKWLKPVSTAMVGIGVATVAGIGLAVKHFANFEQAMKNVQAVSGATAEEFDKLKNFAIEMGSKTVFTAKEAADAMYFLASAGLGVAEQMKTTSAVLDLAAATQTELAESSRIVVNTMSGFTLKAEESRRIADVFAKSISTSQANMSKLGVAMPVVSATMDDLGISLETTVTGLSLLFDKGGRAETAATGLRNAMKKLIDPNKEATAEIKRLGLTMAELDPRTVSLVEIIDRLGKAGFDTAASIKIFGLENDAMNKLVATGAEKFKEFEASLKSAAGAAEDMKDTQLDSLAGDIKLLTSAVDGAVIAFGETFSSTIRKATSELTDLTTEWNNLGDTKKKTIAWTAALGGVGVGLIGGLGLLGTVAPKVVVGLKLLGTALKALPAMGTVAVGLAALGTSLWAVKRAMDAWKAPVDLVAISTNVLTKSQRDLQRALEDLSSAQLDWQDKTQSALIPTLGELDLNINKLNRVLGTNFDETTSSVAAYDGLFVHTQKVTGELNNLTGAFKNTTKEEKESTAEVKALAEVTATTTTNTTALKSIMEALFNPMQALSRLYKSIAFEMGIVNSATLAFLNAAPDVKRTTKQKIAGLTAEANSYREQGIAVRAQTEILKLSDEEKKNIAKSERDMAWEREQQAERDEDLRQQEISGLHIEQRALEMAVEADENAAESKEITQQRRQQVVDDYENLMSRRVKIDETSWLDITNITASGINSVSNSYYRLRDVFHDVNNATNEFHDTWLSSMVDWINNIAGLLNDLTNVWKSAVTIINKVASFLPGGGGGAADIAGAVAGTGGGVGTLGKIGGAASGIGAFAAKVGGGIKAGAGAVAGLPFGQIAGAAGPALLSAAILGMVGNTIFSSFRGEEFSSANYPAGLGITPRLAQERYERRQGIFGAFDTSPITATRTGSALEQRGRFDPVFGGAGISVQGTVGLSGGAGIDRLISKLDQILQTLQQEPPARTANSQEIGSALWELIGPSARQGGFV